MRAKETSSTETTEELMDMPIVVTFGPSEEEKTKKINILLILGEP
jgi:hypothetical protein